MTRKHTWEHHISSEQLRERLGLDSIELYIHARQLRWLGHVRRMGPERLPRLMLSAWVAHERPAGAPQLTYGRTRKCDIGIGTGGGGACRKPSGAKSLKLRIVCTSHPWLCWLCATQGPVSPKPRVPSAP